MMYDFLSNNRIDLIERCRNKVAKRPKRAATDKQLQNGIPLFLDQLIRTLQLEQNDEQLRSFEISGYSGGVGQGVSEMGESAAQHGRELLQMGFTVDQVVHDYGDLCQAITDLAVERDAPFEIDEFRTLNRCLDNAIADAVTEFSYQRDTVLAIKQAGEQNERLGAFAHELRNSLNTATLAVRALKTGNLTISGATGSVLERSLIALRLVIERSLAEVRIAAGSPLNEIFSLAGFIAEIQQSATLEAQVRGCTFSVPAVDPLLGVEADRDLLLSAVGNLLQNAFKFTHLDTEVSLVAYALADRILIDVKDHCGGLPSRDSERIFMPFTQANNDRSGLGLGLSIARRTVEISSGILSIENLPGEGCIFTINLPRHSVPLKQQDAAD